MSHQAAIRHATLPSLVRAAAAALSRASTAAEVLEARALAGAAYSAAKATARLQKAKKAHDDLIAASHRVAADALEIEAGAKRRLADEYDAAQSRGEVARGSVRTDIVLDKNDVRPATAAEIGVSRKDIHDARQLRAAMLANPDIVRDTLDDMLAAGDEPTRSALKRAIAPLAGRANLRAAVGTDSATKAERGNNLYETPRVAIAALLSWMRFSPRVREPACGKGAIASVLEEAGYEVCLADLVDYGTADRHGEVQSVVDFMATEADAGEPLDIVTNPPYGADLNRFVAHALRVHRPRRMALLLNLNFLCGFDDPDRNFAMDENPPATVLVFSRRLPMMHRDGWDGPEAASRMNCAWFVWELRAPRDDSMVVGADGLTYDGPTELHRVDWKTFEGKTPPGPAAEEAGGEADRASVAPPPARKRGRAKAVAA